MGIPPSLFYARAPCHFSLLKSRAVAAKKKRGLTQLIRRPFRRSQPPRSPRPLRGEFFFMFPSLRLPRPAKSREVPRSPAKSRRSGVGFLCRQDIIVPCNTGVLELDLTEQRAIATKASLKIGFWGNEISKCSKYILCVLCYKRFIRPAYKIFIQTKNKGKKRLHRL